MIKKIKLDEQTMFEIYWERNKNCASITQLAKKYNVSWNRMKEIVELANKKFDF